MNLLTELQVWTLRNVVIHLDRLKEIVIYLLYFFFFFSILSSEA